MTSAALTRPAIVRVGVYSRISEIHIAGDDLGVKRHERNARRSVEEHSGWQVVKVFTDNDITASGKKKRPGFEAMLAWVREGRLDVLVATEASRFDRSLDMRDFVRWYATCHDAGIKVMHGGMLADFATGDGLAMLEVAATMAREELRRMTKRARDKREELMNENRPIGRPPFGYRAVKLNGRANWAIATNQDGSTPEADLIRAGVAQLIAGKGTGAVTRLFQDSGLVPNHREGFAYKNGHHVWYTRTVTSLLRSPLLAGITPWGTRAIWKPIISEADHHKVVAVLDRARRGPRAVKNPVSSLSGVILRCALCHGPMAVSNKNTKFGRRRYYLCHNPGCGRLGISFEGLEDVIGGRIVTRLQQTRGTDPDTDQGEVEVEGQLIESNEQLKRLRRLYVMKDLPEGEYQEMRNELEAKQRALQEQLDNLRQDDGVRLYVDRLKREGFGVKNWNTLGVEGRREMVTRLIKRIEVRRGIQGSSSLEVLNQRLDVTWNF